MQEGSEISKILELPFSFTVGNLTFFHKNTRIPKMLSLKGDNLEKLNKLIDWELFRPIIEQAMHKPNRLDGKGRPPNDAIVMFKTLILRELYQLSDDNLEYQILEIAQFFNDF